MNELISISSAYINGQSVQTVNASELHAFLGVAKDFSSWIKAQVSRARLVENRDFIILVRDLGGHNRTDYHLTIESAKYVAIMAGTDNGFQVRDYLIECEHRLHSQVTQYQIPKTMSEALRLAADLAEEKERLALENQKLEADKQKMLLKAEFYDNVRSYAGKLMAILAFRSRHG